MALRQDSDLSVVLWMGAVTGACSGPMFPQNRRCWGLGGGFLHLGTTGGGYIPSGIPWGRPVNNAMSTNVPEWWGD